MHVTPSPVTRLSRVKEPLLKVKNNSLATPPEVRASPPEAVKVNTILSSSSTVPTNSTLLSAEPSTAEKLVIWSCCGL